MTIKAQKDRLYHILNPNHKERRVEFLFTQLGFSRGKVEPGKVLNIPNNMNPVAVGFGAGNARIRWNHMTRI